MRGKRPSPSWPADLRSIPVRFTYSWKRALVEGASELFATNQKSQEKAKEAQINHLYRHIGQLKVERDFLSERSGL